jgi:hypothetical protein
MKTIQLFVLKLNRGWEYGISKKRIDSVYWTYNKNELINFLI